MDLIDEVFGVDEQEVSRRNRATTLLFTELKRKNSLDSQKARCLWLRDRDCNSRFFHSFINRRRKRNEILGLNVNEEWQEKVEDVKKGIHTHFQNQFKSVPMIRPIPDQDFCARRLTSEEN
ncbi:hypothetical protein ACS0TY_022416 [Phlomoides rotata]